MLHFLRRRSPTRLIAVVFTLLVLLVGQGLRLCLHTTDATGAEHTHVAAAHLESNLLSPGEPDDGTDWHVSLNVAVVKQLANGDLAIPLTLALIWLLLPVRQHFAVARRTPLPPSGDFRLRPPLRAPPF